MTDQDLVTGNTLKAEIQKITDVQAIIADADAIPVLSFSKDQSQVISGGILKSILGDSAYNTIVNAAKTSLGTALSSAKSTKQTSFTNLGS